MSYAADRSTNAEPLIMPLWLPSSMSWVILKWFDSYLGNKSQFIMYDNIQSVIRSIKCEVPQGSILGPLLFIIYMNDICNVFLN